jgi:hypothetical protein
LQSERGHESDFLRIARNGMAPVPWRRGLGSGPNPRQERGEEFGYIHYADIHILIGTAVQQDLFTGATFFGCSAAQVEDNHARGAAQSSCTSGFG